MRNVIPILIHQMHISTIQVSPVMLRSKKLEIHKNEKCERIDKIETECHEIEPNPSKDSALHDGYNPSF
jgi:hypothetical protein